MSRRCQPITPPITTCKALKYSEVCRGGGEGGGEGGGRGWPHVGPLGPPSRKPGGVQQQTCLSGNEMAVSVNSVLKGSEWLNDISPNDTNLFSKTICISRPSASSY